jgi:hypothetical protein
MRKFMSWSYFLRLLIITGLFIVFANRFAWPSYKKYLNAGVFINRSSVRRENKYAPAINFCALNNVTNQGWKSKTSVKKNLGTTWVDLYCNNKRTVEETVDCLDDETYNLTETIQDLEIDETEFNVNIIDIDNELWIDDLTDSNLRGMFK